jgi:FMN phosphatase YigB (HAD superfamily)
MSFPDPTRLTALTFDCYGTLIDWETGAIMVLCPLLLHVGRRNNHYLSGDRCRTLRTALQIHGRCLQA